MSETPRAAWIVVAGLTLVGAGVFCTGITWGLPSRAVDPYLFGDRPVWTGQEILERTGKRAADSSRGADVDVDPLIDRDEAICVNETDAQRAEIVRRYRLYTYHPDEMVTMMALASMHPGEGDFDPKLYQYGGLWIYPVGALLRLASAVGAIELTSDLAYYLDNPEAFGRFYVVARLYVVGWAIVGVWVVFALTRRLSSGSVAAATMAAVFYIMMPVVVTLSHEAKPHLPGAVLMLMTVLAAIRYVDTGKTQWWIAVGCLCGASVGMVLAALPVFAVLPVMVLLRHQTWRQRVNVMLAGGVIGGVVYSLTNPYVPINLFVNRELLQSNLGNTAAMFEVARFGEAIQNAAGLVAEGTGILVASAGVVSFIIWLVGLRRSRASIIGWLLAVPALLILLQFTAVATGQPGPYGRFAVLPDIALAAVAATHIGRIKGPAGWVLWLICAAATLPYTCAYLTGFSGDTSLHTSRIQAAEQLQNLRAEGVRTMATFAEPAPYIMPPVDLFNDRLMLVPERPSIETDVVVILFDDDRSRLLDSYSYRRVGPRLYRGWARSISWASKRFLIYRKELPRNEAQLQP